MPPIPNWYYVSFGQPERWLGSCFVQAMCEYRAAEIPLEAKIAPASTEPISLTVQLVPPDEMLDPKNCYRLLTDRSEVERIVGECLLG